MGFRSGAIAPVAPATTVSDPATQLVSQIEAEFDVHGNWDFVEEVITGAAPDEYARRVWKNRGTGTGANAFGSDFHIVIARRVDGTGTVYLFAFEAYDATNNKAIRPCVPTAASLAINANGSHGDETLGFTLDSATLVSAYLPTANTGFDYYIQVSNNRLCAATKYSTTDAAVYVGLFETLMAADPFPLCIIGTSGNENAYTTDAGVSRHPNKTTTETYNFVFQMGTYSPIVGSAEAGDLFHNAAVASRAYLHHNQNLPGQYGRARGLLHDTLLLPDGPTATRNGDTITVGGATYRKYKFGTFGYASGAWVNDGAV
jgi:hypothetical protein